MDPQTQNTAPSSLLRKQMAPEEEQIQLLGKMLLYSVDHLTTREREVYDMLVENLSRRISRLHRLEKHASRLKMVPGEPEPDMDQPDQSKKRVVKNLHPEEVVKLFVECWNTGDFESEYFCLSRDCTKGERKNTPFTQYIENRKKKWETRDIAGISHKSVKEFSSSEMKGNRAIVFCVETHLLPKEEELLWRKYELLFEEGGWRIIDFSTIRKTSRPRS